MSVSILKALDRVTMINSPMFRRKVRPEDNLDPVLPLLHGAWAFRFRPEGSGYLLSILFVRQDTNTGHLGVGESRAEYIAPDATEDSIIKTAFLLFKLLIEHENMESFVVDGVRIFDPHRSVEGHQVGHAYASGDVPTLERFTQAAQALALAKSLEGN